MRAVTSKYLVTRKTTCCKSALGDFLAQSAAGMLQGVYCQPRTCGEGCTAADLPVNYTLCSMRQDVALMATT